MTHHGPILDVPALFIEVGSTEPYWPNEEAAQLLAEVIHDGLGLSDGFLNESLGEWKTSFIGHPVLVTLGGGHYAPKANKLGLENNVWIGHMLANHSLPFGRKKIRAFFGNNRLMQHLHPRKRPTREAKLFAMLRKKSFKGWQRQLIYAYLEELGVEVVKSNAFLEMVKGCQIEP